SSMENSLRARDCFYTGGVRTTARRHDPNPGLALMTGQLLKRFTNPWHITQIWVTLEARVQTTRLGDPLASP
ncbi:hypothetical protein, partial [Stutzerimonas xanthomarina]|uniref:hypothetical protein n=1 Tax=Stutzerimonas xanthomarina TaxID=271420 RepID=UPI003AA97BBF